MNLPHLPPIRFAKEVLSCDETNASVLCEFPSLPTLPMVVEAAAQASSAFSSTNAPLMGFLVLVKETLLLEPFSQTTLMVRIEKRLSLGNSCEFYFEAFEKEGGVKHATGSLMIVLEEQ